MRERQKCEVDVSQMMDLTPLTSYGRSYVQGKAEKGW